MVEAEALGGGARQLLGAEHAGLEQHLLGGLAARLRLLHCGLHALLGNEAELDDHVGDEAPAPTALARRRQAIAGVRLRVYGRRCGGAVAA